MLGWPVTSCLTAYLRIYDSSVGLVLGVSISLQKEGFVSGFMVPQLNLWGISTFFACMCFTTIISLLYNTVVFPSKQQSLDICFGHDSVLKTTPTFTKPSGTWILQERLPDSLAGFHLVRHCQCYYPSPGGSEPATVSSVQYCRDVGM